MRSRITITISQDLLNSVDAQIDGRTNRNRSQVIEQLVRGSLSPHLQTAVILAGGSLCQFSPHKNQPQALVPIKKVPLILHTLQLLEKHGFTTVIICIDKRNLPIKRYLLNRKFSLKLIFITETKPLGTGGALKHAGPLIPDGPFLLLHSDVLTNINLHELASFFFAQNKLACVAIKPRPGKLTFGRVYVEGSRVTNFQQPDKTVPISLINTGIYVLDHACLDKLPKEKVFRLETTLIPKLIEEDQLTAYTFQGIWFDISTKEDYHEASLRWKNS